MPNFKSNSNIKIKNIGRLTLDIDLTLKIENFTGIPPSPLPSFSPDTF